MTSNLLAKVVDLLGTRIEHRAEHVVLTVPAALGDDDDALAGEEVGDSSLGQPASRRLRVSAACGPRLRHGCGCR